MVTIVFVYVLQIVDAIGRIEQTRGETNTAAALHDIRRHFFNAKHSPRAAIVRIAIIVTDGRSDDSRATSHEARLLRESGVHVFAVGVGQDVDMQELNAIASEPAEDYVNTVDNYDALNSIKELLAIKACQGNVLVSSSFPRNVNTSLNVFDTKIVVCTWPIWFCLSNQTRLVICEQIS